MEQRPPAALNNQSAIQYFQILFRIQIVKNVLEKLGSYHYDYYHYHHHYYY